MVPSALAVASTSPSNEKARSFALSQVPMMRERSVSTFQTRILPSSEQAATSSPSGEKATQHTHEQSAPRVLARLVLTFHRRTVSSQLPDATFTPFGEKATVVIWRRQCPRTSAAPLSRFHSRIAVCDKVASAAAIILPSGENEIEVGPPHAPRSVWVCPFCKFHTRMRPSGSALAAASRVPPAENARDGKRLPTSPKSNGSFEPKSQSRTRDASGASSLIVASNTPLGEKLTHDTAPAHCSITRTLPAS